MYGRGQTIFMQALLGSGYKHLKVLIIAPYMIEFDCIIHYIVTKMHGIIEGYISVVVLES